MKTIKCYATLALLLLLGSCEKFTADSESATPKESNDNVTLLLTEKERVRNACQRVSFAIFKVDEKLHAVNQTHDDAEFGTTHLSLSPALYRIVAIGYNGEGNCSISAPEKISFYNNKMTDTFYYYGTWEVKEGEATTDSITLQRGVAMFRLHITDDIPTEAKRIRFYFTGGSSTLNARTGLGCVNSKQTETMDLLPSKKDYDIYTFPQGDNTKLKIQITVFNAEADTLVTKTFENVSITRNYITKYSGKLFGTNLSGDSTQIGMDFIFDPKWKGETITNFQ